MPASKILSSEPSESVAHQDWKAVFDRVDRITEAFVNSQEDSLGSLEEQLRREMNTAFQRALTSTLQKRADSAGRKCLTCGTKLIRGRHTARTIKTIAGPIRIKRYRGYCPTCKKWVCPADEELKLDEGVSPLVEEMTALFASKMPIAEASKVMQRATGVEMPPASLDREAKRIGRHAQKRLDEMNEDPTASKGAGGPVQTLIIEIDAWNLRERDQWGLSQALREKGEEPKRWHWVWVGTIFNLEQRLEKNQRPVISNRGYVATLEGKERFQKELHSEALRRGLAQAQKVIVLGDGAAWIWNLADDRFKEADQRLDLYHVYEHLESLGRALFKDVNEAKRWIKRKKKQFKGGKVERVIEQSQGLLEGLEDVSAREAAEKELAYMESHRERMDYDQAIGQGEPLGSGAIESTCRQYQCRFKRPGQFWSRQGDQPLLCLETYWRNDRGDLLFPHVNSADLYKN